MPTLALRLRLVFVDHGVRGMLFVAPHLGLQAKRRQLLEHWLEIGFFLEIGFGVDAQIDVAQRLHHARIAQAALHFVEHLLEFVEVKQEPAQLRSLRSSPSGGAAAVRMDFDGQVVHGAARDFACVSSLSSLMYFSLLPFLML